MRSINAMWMACMCSAMQAQTPTEEWYRTFDGAGATYDEIRLVRIDAQGNVIVTGSSYSGPGTYFDVVTREYDPAGDVAWTQTWNNDDLGFDDRPKDMAIAPNGDIIIVGNSKQSSNSQDNDADIFILALSPNGDLLWSDHFSGTGYTSGGGALIDVSFAGGVAITALGDIYVTGMVTGDGSTQYQQMVLAKYDASGAQQWLETFDSATDWPNSDQGLDVGVDAAGNAYVSGLTVLLTSWFDPVVWKIDGNGQFVWLSTYAGPVSNVTEQFEEILVDGNGNSYAFGTNSSDRYVVRKLDASGSVQWTLVLDTISATINATFSGSDKRLAFDGAGNVLLATNMNSRIGVAKITPAGNLLWVTLHGGTAQYMNEAYHVVTDALNNIYVAGAVSNTGSSYYDLGLFKIDPDGNELWAVSRDGPTSMNDKGHSMAITADGAIYVGGVAAGYTTSNGDYFLVKYMQGPIGVQEIPPSSMSIHPDPSDGLIQVHFDDHRSLHSMEVWDMQGRIVHVELVNGPIKGERTIDLRHLDHGSYLLRATMDDGTLVGRVVLQ